jgi:hypothetical protein
MGHGGQAESDTVLRAGGANGRKLVIPNPKLKLLDQVRELLRVMWGSATTYLHSPKPWPVKLSGSDPNGS